MIRIATSSDLGAVTASLDVIVTSMRAAGNDQWGPLYPTGRHFNDDYAKGSLFVDEEGGRIRGFMTLNFEEPDEYVPLPWTVGQPALVVHRLAVIPEFRRQGVAEGLFAFAEAQAAERRLAGLRSDTYSRNPGMIALFAKRSWTLVGTLKFAGREAEFLAWEKTVARV